MGRYISTGIVYQYCFSKSEVERQYENIHWEKKSFSEIKQQIINQLFPEIYDYEEDESNLYIYLSDSLHAEDLVSTMKAYCSLARMSNDKMKEIESIGVLLQGRTMNEAYKYAEEKPSCLFHRMELGTGSYYACPLSIDGQVNFYRVHASIIMIDSSSAKTMTEDDLLSYDFFTDLLRYRMKPDKLADSMIIFLSP